MDNDPNKKLSIINSILSLESKTNDALRYSRDEIDRLEIVAACKKSEVQKLEDELNALLHISCKMKKKKTHKLRPKTLRRRTISAAGNHESEEVVRRSVSSGCSNISKRSEQESISATVFTVQTFDKSDDEMVSLWTSFQNDGDADAGSSQGGGRVGRSNDGASHLNFDVGAAKESVSQMETLLSEKIAELEKYKQTHSVNARKLQQMQQQLSQIKRQQSMRCEEHKSNIQLLTKTKTDLISRIRWRENRILEEEKNIAELKGRLTAAKSANKSLHQRQDSIFFEMSDDDHKELMKLTTQCADLLTEFSSSIFKTIKSAISLPSHHSSISFSIGDPSDTSIADSTKKQQEQSEKSTFDILSTENDYIKLSADERQKLDELQKSEEHYDANIKMMQNEIESLQCAHNEEIELNKAVLDNLENHIAALNERLLKRGHEVKRLVEELEDQNK